MTYRIERVAGKLAQSEIIALHRWCFGKETPIAEPDEGYWWIVYDAEDQPAAFAGLVASQAIEKAGYLVRAGVLPAHRGKGLQSRLIRVRERQAKRLNWEVLRTDTTDNIHSANNLIRAGYTLFKPHTPWAFSHSLYWRKFLI